MQTVLKNLFLNICDRIELKTKQKLFYDESHELMLIICNTLMK